MSYRDVRNCTEMLRALGYPMLVSMESFRKPNFPLVASLLLWLTKRFDPDVDIIGDMRTEDERVALIRNVAQFMALKANVKLNTKRLYQADGYAVREILKVTSLLYDALVTNASEHAASQEEDVELSIRDFDFADKLHDLKQSRQLASEITMTGASLFDLLGKEINLRGMRDTSVRRLIEVHDVEGGILRAIEVIGRDIEDTKSQVDNVSANETSLDGKIERRKVEIERYEKRLQTLKKVRPAFMEEFVSLEAELNSLFEKYSIRVRCLAQLEKLAAEAERAQIQRAQLASSQRAITTTIPLEDATEDDLIIDEPMNTTQNAKITQKMNTSIDRKPPPSRQDRPRARTGGRTRQENVAPNSNLAKVYGGMDPGQSNSNSSLDISSDDSEDDELFLDKDEPELVDVQSDEDSLGLEFSAMDINKRAPSGRMTSSKVTMPDNSDDDF